MTSQHKPIVKRAHEVTFDFFALLNLFISIVMGLGDGSGPTIEQKERAVVSNTGPVSWSSDRGHGHLPSEGRQAALATLVPSEVC